MSAPRRSPRIRRLVMFKHGVAYLERGGPADGPFELSFRREEMNDVLKSLAVWVADGEGSVGAVTFESPEDPVAALEERGLSFPPGEAFRGLVLALRGRRVRVDAGAGPREGEVIGLESVFDSEARHRQRLLVRTAPDRVEVVDTESLRQLELLEASTRADVSWLVDKSRAARSREHRAVRVALDGSPADLRVAYTVPAPMWRVSYRVVVDGEDATVMAWAIVHNPADEVLEDVELTLTTGQPVSFVIDLYRPRHVARAVVQEAERAAAAPRAVERALQPPGAPPPAPRAAAPAPAAGGAPARAKMAAFGGQLLEHHGAAAETSERSELFEYRVRTPVTLDRGGSAMVPIAAAKVSATRERLYRPGDGPHPDILLRFDNDTGVVLEEGPAVIYDDSGYAGEAMVPYSARGTEVRLAFARDLSVRCRVTPRSEVFLAGVRIAESFAMESHEHRIRHRLRADNEHGQDVSVLFELPRHAHRELAEGGPAPVETTASAWRFRLDVSARAHAELEVVERWRQAERIQLRTLHPSRLQSWIGGQLVDDAMQGALSGVLATLAEAAALSRRADELERDRADLQGKVGSLTQQLQVLREGGDEGALRLHYARELRDTQTRIDALAAEARALRDRAAATERRAADTLSGLESEREHPAR